MTLVTTITFSVEEVASARISGDETTDKEQLFASLDSTEEG